MPLRLVYYHGGMIRDALKESECYDKMKPTITISITDFVAFNESINYISEFFLIEKNSRFMITETTKKCCIELPKLAKNKSLDHIADELEESKEILQPHYFLTKYTYILSSENSSEYK